MRAIRQCGSKGHDELILAEKAAAARKATRRAAGHSAQGMRWRGYISSRSWCSIADTKLFTLNLFTAYFLDDYRKFKFGRETNSPYIAR